MRTRMTIALAGCVAGLLAVLFLPASWLFTTEFADHAVHGEGAQFACPMFCVVMDQMPEDGRCPVCGMELDEVSGEQKLNRAEQGMVGPRPLMQSRL